MKSSSSEIKQLTRPFSDRKIAGVASGMARYFSIDTTLVRVLLAFFIVATGFFPGVVLYLLAWVIIPDGK
jgi:phage shock protein C